MKDFFSRYRANKTYQYLFSGVLSLVFTMGLTGMIRDVPLGMLSANVLMAPVSETPNIYAADILIERSGSTIIVRMGKNAEQVDSLSFSLLGDPMKFNMLTTSGLDTTIISNEPGAYIVKIELHGTKLTAGQVLTTLETTLPKEAFIAPIDATFLSAGQSYSLSLETK